MVGTESVEGYPVLIIGLRSSCLVCQKGEGASLGLAIAKAIVSGIGGQIEMVSPRKRCQDGFDARSIPDR
jgi:hypothetical protein